jgi:hypothetical protein
LKENQVRTKQEIEADLNREYVLAGELQYMVAAYTNQLLVKNQAVAKLHQEMHDVVSAPGEKLQETTGMELTRGEG